jgi:GDSL-like Lipase/Acylhydrolase family
VTYVAHHLGNEGERPEGSLENAAGLVPFFEQASHPPASGRLHVLQYGDSHTASDDWANTMRQGLQSRFGAGGAGFAFAGHPYRGYRRFDISGASSPGWFTDGLVGRPGDGMYGLGGVSITAQSANETVSLSTDCAELQLLFLQQPGGGQLEFSMDGSPVQSISTDGALSPGYFNYKPSPGSHQYTLRTLSSAPVRLFGWIAEKQSGLTWETLGINGASATMLLDWNESILASHIARRDPALIVLAYGTNEALSPKWTREGYRAAFTEVIERFRRAAPTASILVVGPPDCEMRVGRRMAVYPHLNQVIEIQREIAFEHGCAFWDWRARMGGPGAVSEWVTAGLAQPDHVHLTTTGYRLLGQILLDEIMQQYTRFLAVRTE